VTDDNSVSEPEANLDRRKVLPGLASMRMNGGAGPFEDGGMTCFEHARQLKLSGANLTGERYFGNRNTICVRTVHFAALSGRSTL